MDFVIREATGDDYEELRELFDQGSTIHHEGEPGIIGDPWMRPTTRAFLLRLLNDESSAIFVAELNDTQPDGHKLAGFIQLSYQDTEGIGGLASRRYVLVMDVEVRAAHQRQGIGHKLMEAGDKWAVSIGATQLELSVWEFNNRALTLYERLGYRTIYRQMVRDLT
ncbi:MAG: N-acetyltransferase [Chloroflexia bacterium]